MLVLTSVLLLVAVGFLAVALFTGQIWLAWVSIAASAAAALALLVRWWRLRRTRGRHRPAGQRSAPARVDSSQRAPRAATPQPATSQPDTPPQPDTPQPGSATDPRPHGEPAEEDTDAADLLLVCELDDEVLVVDERPRYHLAGCRWVGTRATEALAVQQARELGFTPCAGCGPDGELAVRHRATSTG